MNESNGHTTKKKPRGKPFTGNDDPRNNRSGQRNAGAVATATAMREMYVQVLAEPMDAPPVEAQSKVEAIVRQHVTAAANGDAHARETLLDRIFGKSTQHVEGTNSTTPKAVQFVPYEPLTIRIVEVDKPPI